ncbi:MAG: hypothetical protein Q9159_003146 [Coniocarpon cinnabarinum]
MRSSIQSLLLAGAAGLAAAQGPQVTAPAMLGALGEPLAGNGTNAVRTRNMGCDSSQDCTKGVDNSSQTDDGKYTISAEGIRAQFVPYGASISNLFINDTNGVERDIVLGWDNATYYTEDGQHPHFGAVPGRYANRIKNATFDLDGETYHITPNEHVGEPGEDALHGGLRGWDWRNWTVTAHTTDSITFSIVDPDGAEGFPGEVISYVTYTLTPYSWHIRMLAFPTTKTTPIMLSSHTYWNLDAFQNPATNGTALNHTLSLPYSGQRIYVDGDLIPTGDVAAIQPYSFNDFRTSPKQVGANFSSPGDPGLGNCGTGCTGYDTCFLFNARDALDQYDWQLEGPVATLSSDFTGINVNVFTDQHAFQVYSCGGQNGTVTVKETQGTDSVRTVPKYGCVVLEVQDWIDGINQPEWGRQPHQIFGPGDEPYVLNARYDFSVSGSSQATNYGDGGMKPRPRL